MTTSAQSSRRGTVLIVVLVLVLLMSVAAYGFLLAMQTENIAARASGVRLVAEQSAFSGIELFSAMLEMPRALRREHGGVADNPNMFGGVPLDDSLDAADEDAPRFIVTPPDPATDPQAPVRFGAVDESAKLHLSKLVEWDQVRPDSGRQALLRLPGMTPDVADAILDWVDADSQPRFEGAEADAAGRRRIAFVEPVPNGVQRGAQRVARWVAAHLSQPSATRLVASTTARTGAGLLGELYRALSPARLGQIDRSNDNY
ncbi:MAG: general secretion pathway protein GspK [Planctomycetia bacterium]|nr:general secretion pathway protein GspK [Planctomycetia bacterium]